MHMWQVSLAGNSGSLIGCLLVTSCGASNFNAAESLDGAYLGPFTTVWHSAVPFGVSLQVQAARRQMFEYGTEGDQREPGETVSSH